MHEGSIRLKNSNRIWKSWAPPRVKFFTWLAVKGRLWTADRRRRHNLEAHDTCWLCNQEQETGNHILVNCSFAKEIWWGVLSSLGCNCTFPTTAVSLQGWWTRIRRLQPREKRRGLDTLAMLIIWNLWKERNARLFEDCPSSVPQLLHRVQQELALWVQAGAWRMGVLASE
ncbi:unnamed protein product [Urochloa decumbens]|uniref:Reverse transcriptase zinc-binding domain-containing protein n=1 Tax=Urochloa decumbens TaxID=240449 RepID=A0ABC9HFV2_9POAL